MRDTLAEERRILALVLIGTEQFVFGFTNFVQRRARSDLPFVEIEIVQNVADDGALIRVVHDREVRSDADLLAVAAQHAHADGMERADPKIAGRRADHLLEPRLKFGRRLIRKRDREDAVREDTLLIQQVSDAMSEDPRFAATRSGEDKNGAVRVRYSTTLNVTKRIGLDNHHPTVFDIEPSRASERSIAPNYLAIRIASERFVAREKALER